MNVGEQYALSWPKFPHLIDATIVALERDYLVCDVRHRCTLGCNIKQLQRTLPLEGTLRYDYHFFAAHFVPRNADAIPLPAISI